MAKTVLGILEFVSLLCALHLWRRTDTTPVMKFLWTIIIFVPLAGPILYGGLFKPPGSTRYRKHWPEDRGGVPPGGAITGSR